MSALVRALLGLLLETTVWCALMAAVALVVAVGVSAVFGAGRRPRVAVVHAAIGAAIAVGLADRAGLPPLWRIGPSPRQVAVLWAAAGAVLTAVVEEYLARRRSTG